MKLEFQETDIQPSDMPFILNVKTKNYVAKINENTTSECVDAIYNHLKQEEFSLVINKDFLFFMDENDDSIMFSEIASVGGNKLFEARIAKGKDKKKIVELWYKLGALNIFSILMVGKISPHDFGFMKEGWWIFREWVPVFKTNACFDIYYLYYDANSLIRITNK